LASLFICFQFYPFERDIGAGEEVAKSISPWRIAAAYDSNCWLSRLLLVAHASSDEIISVLVATSPVLLAEI
jgi:hypothetical protein